MNPAREPTASIAALDDDAWERLRSDLLADLGRRACWLPHVEAVHRHAFAAVRERMLAGTGGLAPPAVYWVPKLSPAGTPPPQRRHSVLHPVEDATWTLLSAAALAAAEPGIDRCRVHSAQPAGVGQPGLMAPRERWTLTFSRSLETLAATAPAVVRLDIVRCGEAIDRKRLLAGMTASGLAPAWLALAQRVFDGCTATLGPTGLPVAGFGDASLATLALDPLDRWCAARGIPSVRIMDDTVLAAPGFESARRMAAEAQAVIVGLGLETHPGKMVVQAGSDLLAERCREQARTAMPSWTADAALAQFLALTPEDPRFAPVAHAALARLEADADRRAVPHVIERFERLPAAARTFSAHIATAMEDQAVADRMSALLVRSARTLHPWQWAWGVSAFRRARRIAGSFGRALTQVVADPAAPMIARVAAAAVRTRFSTRADWTELERLMGQVRSRHVRATIAHGLVHRTAADRRPLLRQWATRDPVIALVATAIDRPGIDDAATP